MKRLLLVIVLMLVAVVLFTSPTNSNVNLESKRSEATQIDFEDFGSSDVAPPWGPVHP